MTREEVMKGLEAIADCTGLSVAAKQVIGRLSANDAEQRQEIGQLRKELALIKQDDAARCTLIRDMEDEERRKDAVIEQQAQEIAWLREALQLLYDVQNGCPLPKYQEDWDLAMALTQQALKETMK